MKNIDQWIPSKFIFKHNKLIANRDVNEVSLSSRMMADIIAFLYSKYIPVYCKGKLIDLGCGKVPLYHVYKNFIEENVCVDWPNSNHKSNHIDFECNLNEVLPFNTNIFDTIILSDVLEHIYSPQLLWQEMYRILKKDGFLLMNIPFYYWIHEEPNDYYRYTRYAIEKFALESGFKIIEITPLGGIPEILTDIHCKFYTQIPYIGNIMSELIRIKSKLFLKTFLGKKISKSTAEKFPLGYFVIAKKQ